MEADLELVMDDGTTVHRVKLGALLDALRRAKQVYDDCGGGDRCYVDALNVLMGALGSLMINVVFDDDFSTFLVRTMNRGWVIVDGVSGRHVFTDLDSIARCVLQ